MNANNMSGNTNKDEQYFDCPSGLVSGELGITESFFSNYEILERGDNHVFYRARRYGRWYVLKGLREDFRNNPLYEEWLSKEYSVGIGLDFPTIVRVESLEDDPMAGRCIVMEWVEGMTLDRWLRETKPNMRTRRGVMNQILDAVEYCHSRGIYHHDLKPSNVMVTAYGGVKLIDFGLSDGPQYAALKSNSGTQGYAAPEQQSGGTCDHRADIYALGKIADLLYPHSHRHAKRKAQREDQESRFNSVADFRRDLWRLRWPWLMLLSVLMLAIVGIVMLPSDKIYPVKLDSGQTVYCRVLTHFPERKVIFVYPGTQSEPWPMRFEQLKGDMIIPDYIKMWGLRYRVAEIEGHAFRNQFELTSLTLPEHLDRIGPHCFMACSGIKDTLVIPRHLKVIGADAFNDCASITTVLWQPDSCKLEREPTDGIFCFDRCPSLKRVIMTNNVRSAPSYLFNEIHTLKYISLPDSMKIIPNDFLAYSHDLDSIDFPVALYSIEHAAFYKTGIKRVRFPESVEVIGNYSFAYSKSLQHVECGSSTRFIGNFAFTECSSLQTLTIHAPNPPEVLNTSFYLMPQTVVLRVPMGSVEKYRTHPIWGKFNHIEAIEG